MKRIAEVVINSRVKSLDRTFHYLAGEDIKAGMRVEVPFGNANLKQIGYVTGFVEKSEIEELKEIIKPIDETPMLSEQAIELAEYIKKTCLCPMSEAIRLLLPPNIKTKFERRVRLSGDIPEDLTEQQKTVADTLLVAKSEIEINDLKKMCGLKNTSAITALAKKNIIEIREVLVGQSKEKTKKFAVLTCENPEEALAELRKKAKAAAVAFEIIAEHERLPVSDVLSMAECYYSSLEVLEERGYIEIETETVYRTPVTGEGKRSVSMTPTEEQKKALAEIFRGMESGEFSPFLLHGVTGSGKTEVFLQAAEKCLENGRNVIILVPEIALTPQMTERFVSRFGEDIALLHSGLSMGERFDQWRKIKAGEVKLVVGARSAIFAPFDNVGLIVVDEEHETSYKSESSPRYSAKNIALMRGKQYNSTVIFASATPSIETYFNAEGGRYKLLKLKNRHNGAQLPIVETVDMAAEFANGNRSVISKKLAEEIYENLKNGEQTILFLNRRGYSSFVSCRSCGYTVKCPHCSVTMTYHSKGDMLTCHYCGYRMKNITVCPECESVYIKYFGTGTQRAEEELKKLFPGITVLRMDADTTSQKLSHRRIFKQFRDENINVLLGTQMVTKGLDFPNVTLVGVLSADILLNRNDFRAAEYAFSQLTQVCGRAGRGSKAGRAVIQTYSPASEIIKMAEKQDYEEFYEQEIKMRYMLGNPPFVKLVNIIFSSEDAAAAEDAAKKSASTLIEEFEKNVGVCREMYGPAPAPIEKIKNSYRYRILIKFTGGEKMLDILEKLKEYSKLYKKVKTDIVINPVAVL